MKREELDSELRIFDQLPNSAFVRMPVVKALFACSTMTVWRMAKDGRIPKPHKISARATLWNVGELRVALKRLLDDKF